jgi:hypothetical protein
MKTLLASTFLLLVGFASLCAQEVKQPEIRIITEDDAFEGLMVDANDREFLWRETEKSTLTRRQRLSTCTVYFLNPPEFVEAMELYRSRNYQEAADAFAKCAEDYKRFKEVKGNPATLAGFYQLECYRRLQELEKLMELAGVYDPQNLLHEYHKVQYEMYGIFWDAVRTKSWARLDAICRDPKWREQKLPGGLRAQVAYCQGLAKEGVEDPIGALNAYNGAFVADFSASEEITRKSALNCLRILRDHPDVKTAMRLYPTEDYSDDSNGAALIKEATALLTLWDKVLGGGEPVPAQYKVFLDYPPKKD